MEHATQRLIQNIFTCYKKQLKNKPLPLKHLKAVDAITKCRTGALGVSAYECESKSTQTLIAHSCRHRSCSNCAAKSRHAWLEAQNNRLLDCPHFHCVFTLPSEYHVLWQYNQRWFTSTFFDVVRSVLMDFVQEKDGSKLTPGILMAMHTWGRQLTLHPHIHCVVTGGGQSAAGQWRDLGKYLLPARQARVVYRGRFQSRIKEAYESGELQLPPDQDKEEFYAQYRKTYGKTWCIRIEEQYAHGRGVLSYLSRYLRGSPLNASQIVHCDNSQIGFRYLDHRTKRTKIQYLKPMEFIRRLLLHVPETGQHMVRHYGLYGGASRERRNHCRDQIGGLLEKHGQQDRKREPLSCRCCNGSLRLKWVQYANRKKGISYRVRFWERDVQQNDEPDIDWAKKYSDVLLL